MAPSSADQRGGVQRELGVDHLGFGRIIASEIEILNMHWYKVGERWYKATMRPSPTTTSKAQRFQPQT